MRGSRNTAMEAPLRGHELSRPEAFPDLSGVSAVSFVSRKAFTK